MVKERVDGIKLEDVANIINTMDPKVICPHKFIWLEMQMVNIN